MKTRIISRVAVLSLLWLAIKCTSAHAEIKQGEHLRCMNNLKQLAVASAIWATHHADAAPPDVLSMSNEIATPKVLVCPADPGHQPARDWAALTTNNLSYEFLRPSATNTGPQQVVFRCPIHGLTALLNGSVQQSEPGAVSPPVAGDGTAVNREFEDLKRALQDRDPAVRRAAVQRLVAWLGEAQQVLLTPRKELLDPYQAAQSAGARLLAGLLKDEDEQVRRSAASALMMCGPSAKVAVPQLLEVLQGNDRNLQTVAVDRLGALGTNAVEAIPMLEKMLATSSGLDRLAVAQALWKITRRAAPVLPVLIEALEIKGTNYAYAWPSVSTARILGEIGPEAKAAVPVLSRLLEASELEARVAAAAALARISPDTPGIAEPLVASLRYNRGFSQWFAQQALRELGARSVPALVKVADDPSPIVRRLAIETLGGIGEPAGEAAPVLSVKLQDPDEWVRRAAADALGKMGAAAKSAVPALRATLQDTSGTVRAAAAIALVRVDAPALEAIPTLVAAISRFEPREGTAYIEACNAAREISPVAVPAVLEFVKAAPAPGASSWDRERTYRLQRGAIDLLGRMGPNAKAAVPDLRQLANESNESHRREIAEALQQIELPTVEESSKEGRHSPSEPLE